MRRFLKLVWAVFKSTALRRLWLVPKVIVCFLPLLLLVVAVKDYEDTLPEGMAAVLYVLFGFLLLFFLLWQDASNQKKK
jgi:protein-S-isoprenylcysteine O-methyltransferase Ste14